MSPSLTKEDWQVPLGAALTHDSLGTLAEGEVLGRRPCFEGCADQVSSLFGGPLSYAGSQAALWQPLLLFSHLPSSGWAQKGTYLM